MFHGRGGAGEPHILSRWPKQTDPLDASSEPQFDESESLPSQTDGDYTPVHSEVPDLGEAVPVEQSTDYGNDTDIEYPDYSNVTEHNHVDSDLEHDQESVAEELGHAAVDRLNSSASALVGGDYYDGFDPDFTPPNDGPKDVLDKARTNGKGSYRLKGKILYAVGDSNWKLRLVFDHNCNANGTVEVSEAEERRKK